jgi:hypothetical protein
MKAIKITLRTINQDGRVDGTEVLGYYANNDLANKAIENFKEENPSWSWFYDRNYNTKDIDVKREEIEIITE